MADRQYLVEQALQYPGVFPQMLSGVPESTLDHLVLELSQGGPSRLLKQLIHQYETRPPKKLTDEYVWQSMEDDALFPIHSTSLPRNKMILDVVLRDWKCQKEVLKSKRNNYAINQEFDYLRQTFPEENLSKKRVCAFQRTLADQGYWTKFFAKVEELVKEQNLEELDQLRHWFNYRESLKVQEYVIIHKANRVKEKIRWSFRPGWMCIFRRGLLEKCEPTETDVLSVFYDGCESALCLPSVKFLVSKGWLTTSIAFHMTRNTPVDVVNYVFETVLSPSPENMREAIMNDNLFMVQELYKRGVSLAIPNYLEMTITHRMRDISQFLIAHGATPPTKDFETVQDDLEHEHQGTTKDFHTLYRYWRDQMRQAKMDLYVLLMSTNKLNRDIALYITEFLYGKCGKFTRRH